MPLLTDTGGYHGAPVWEIDPVTGLPVASPGALLPTSLGTKAAAASLAVTLSTEDKAFLDGLEGMVDGLEGLLVAAASASATFTPAAASHVAGDCNGAAQTFSAIGPASRLIRVVKATLLINSATVEGTAWRLNLYNVTPPSALADDAAFDVPSGDQASFLGYIDLGTAVDLGSTQWVQNSSIGEDFRLAASGNLFGYLVNLTTLTPAAVAHIVTLHSVPL